MTGKYSIDIYNNRVHFHLEIKRNITIIQGDSATGKTQLVALLSDYNNNGASSGVTLKCDCPCTVYTNADWKQERAIPPGHIVFVDEDFEAMHSREFAGQIHRSDNYYVLICRDSLYELAYSIEEIYGMRMSRESQKYSSAKRIYNELYHLYNVDAGRPLNSDCVVTEDSNAGYEFFRHLYGNRCVSAGGKSSVLHCLYEESMKQQKALAIVDGAAFGAEMEKVIRFIRNCETSCALYAPESFEYLILCSGLVNAPREITEKTWIYADSARYHSWEDFFTHYLIEASSDTVYQYQKRKLNPAFLAEKAVAAIKKSFPEEMREAAED